MPIAALPSTAAAALQIAATQVARFIAGGTGTLKGRMWSLDYRTLEARVHVLTRRPQCPECGNPKAAAPVRVVLGTNEPPAVAPDAVARALEAHVSPITGIVPILQKSGECAGVHVYQARYNSALPLTSEPVRVIREPGYAVGKGFTDGQARASCLAEAVERYSTVFQGCEPRIRARYCDIREQAVHPENLLLFSSQQYRNRDHWNRTHAANHWVPWPFDESAVIDWTPCWSLTRGEFRYMPVAWCYLDYLLTDTEMFCAADTNGCAAGSSLGEAVLRASLELVERDAVAIWWYNRLRRPSVLIEELDDPWLALVEAQLRASGRSLHVLDITTDLAIPAFVAVSAEADGAAVLFGAGAHLDPRVAAKRAIAELCQVLSGLNGETPPPNIAHWLQTATLENQPYLAPLEGESCSARAFRTPAGETPWVICRRQGMETLVVDLTRPDTGLVVVRVSVPGLRHHWSRFAPGRLYEVPVKMGWLEAPTEESQLNPIPFFL
jgi:oxazoline/thiazoline synthase